MFKRSITTVVLVAGLTLVGCAKKAPAVTPAQLTAQEQEAVSILDVLQATAQAMNQQTPKLLSDSGLKAVTQAHDTAEAALKALPTGWKASVQAAFDQLPNDMTAAEYAKVQPFVLAAETIINLIK